MKFTHVLINGYGAIYLLGNITTNEGGRSIYADYVYLGDDTGPNSLKDFKPREGLFWITDSTIVKL